MSFPKHTRLERWTETQLLDVRMDERRSARLAHNSISFPPSSAVRSSSTSLFQTARKDMPEVGTCRKYMRWNAQADPNDNAHELRTGLRPRGLKRTSHNGSTRSRSRGCRRSSAGTTRPGEARRPFGASCGGAARDEQRALLQHSVRLDRAVDQTPLIPVPGNAISNELCAHLSR